MSDFTSAIVVPKERWLYAPVIPSGQNYPQDDGVATPHCTRSSVAAAFLVMLEKHNLKSPMWYFRTHQAVWFTVVTGEARLHAAPRGEQPTGRTV